MSLAGRIDYEAARALEWRGGELETLPGAERVEAELIRDLGGSTPAESVILRARLLLGGPGEKAALWLAGAIVLLCVLAAIAGVQVARFALGDPAAGPVNIAWFLGHALGLQSLFLLATLLLTVGGRGALGRALSGTLSLGALALGAALRLSVPRPAGVDVPSGRDVLERLRGLPELRPLALAASHGAWTSFNLGLLAASALILSAEHHAFAWQSTFVQDEARAQRVLHALTLPAGIWPHAPTAEQVRVSRFDPESGRFLDDGDSPAHALSLRQGWSTQLLASVAGWGLLPRSLLLIACWFSWRSRRGRLAPEASDPYLAAVLARLAPTLSTETEGLAQEPLPEAARELCGPAAGGAQLLPHAAAWLAATQGADPVEALLGAREANWRSLPSLDSRAAEAAALEAIEAPALLVLLCDWSTTPDAALGRFLAEAAPARTVLVLSGGSAFRATRRGASPGGLLARRSAWETAASRWGVAPEDLVDFDAGSVTREARAQLRARLGLAGTADIPRSRGFSSALARVRLAAARWERDFRALEADAFEAARLRAAAEIRADVESCFVGQLMPAGDGAGAVIVSAAKAVLSERIAGVSDEGWRQSIGEAARWGRLLGRIKDLDPRWSAAGLLLGLVAGPLGGALAAGSAGLIAGASLSSTLAPLGAALGCALSLRRETSNEPPEEAAASDLLGLPARAGVLRALELQLQGRGEDSIARALGELGRSAAGCASIDTEAELTALCEEALRIGESS